MSCSTNEKIDRYDFYNNIDKYIAEVRKIEKPIPPNTPITECDEYSNMHSLGNKEKANILCNNFARLNKFVASIETEVHNKCNFLNYWLNSELSQTWFSKDNTVSEVYIGIESYIFSNEVYAPLNCDLCNINKDELYKINKLYNLYKNYSKLNTIIDSEPDPNKQEIIELSTQCCADYNDVSYICKGNNKNNNLEFCNILNDFELKYHVLYQSAIRKGSDYSNNLIILSECPNNKIITTAVTGTVVGLIPLLGVLYKFTPMGQVFRSKMGILNNDIRNTDEDMTNIPLMGQDSDNIISRQGTYNIKYQSL
ncbi:hypothetical protein PVC01_000110000 [Plasmodium vivax]|uniref:VIR protein n=1 Tax=Plasmodium vivax TaxID=5855 RepID=A0A1G4E5N1_PLAVI|nr:hypothetical protein PVC01_000110000 [Plasmodium vivax]